ncbi:MAG: RHS repeat-associated core domain-containing protein [Caldilineaceae bacterium]
MVYDYENRLRQVKQRATVLATFVYDANGQRVKSTVGAVTTIYIGSVYEYQAGATTHYYEGNALRRTGYASNNGVFYLLQDHLKSSSAIASQTGVVNAADRDYYLPFGGNRGGAFSALTTKRFTGQYHEASLPGGEGLSYYGARWYDAKLGRFLSADTVVPTIGSPQALNRYSYVHNNPVVFTDSTGHCADGITTVVCAAVAGGTAGALVGGGWYLVNEAWYGEVDLSVSLVWTEDSWIPGIKGGEDWGDLGTAAGSGFVAGATAATGGAIGSGVVMAMGTGAAGNLVADHLTDSLFGNDFNAGEHIIAGAAGAAGGAMGGAMASTTETLAETVGATGIGSKAVIMTQAAFGSALGESGVYEMAGQHTDPLTFYTNVAWNVGGEALGAASQLPTKETLGGYRWAPVTYQINNAMAWKTMETSYRNKSAYDQNLWYQNYPWLRYTSANARQ